MTLREAVAIRDELVEEESVLDNTFGFEEVCEGGEEVEKYKAPKCETMQVFRDLQTQVVHVDSDQRDQLFHTKCHVNDR